MMTPVKLDRTVKKGHRVGAFGIEILYPGLALDHGDSGIGAIGRIDHARIGPGALIKMHPHRDDEILTYMRAGTMLHRDTVGNEEALTNTRLMLMNAGHTFQHEEKTVGSEPIEALQIFIRPGAADLEPMVQFHDLEEPLSRETWRRIAGPKGERRWNCAQPPGYTTAGFPPDRGWLCRRRPLSESVASSTSLQGVRRWGIFHSPRARACCWMATAMRRLRLGYRHAAGPRCFKGEHNVELRCC